MHVSASNAAKPGDRVVVGARFELKESMALYESMQVPLSYASNPTVTIWLF